MRETKCCGTCRWHNHSAWDGEWECVNEDGESYGAITDYDDWCNDYEEKD